MGTPSSGELTAQDCRLENPLTFAPGTYADPYSTTVATAGEYRFRMTAGFDTFLILTASDGSLLALNDDIDDSGSPSEVRVLMPAGAYGLLPGAYRPNVTGPYTLLSAPVSSDVTSCDEVWVVRGISTSQNLQATDCVRSGFFSDRLDVFLRAGQTITLTMTSTAFDAFLELYDGPTRVAFNDDFAAGSQNAQLSYTAPTDAFFSILPTSGTAGATGPYVLTVQ
jgi:hypothetical protein